MLTEILSRDACAQCRLCCVFDSSDIWETPVITPALREKILREIDSETKFLKKGECSLFRLENPDVQGLYYCPMLRENGCVLGEEKPFDCAVWPFRVMNVRGRRAVTIAPICPAVMQLPLEKLLDFVKSGLGDKIFRYADKHNEIVKDHDESYPILLFEEDKKGDAKNQCQSSII